ncbi:serine/threonine-protein kinase [Polyangium aurulentum]|uniref:serine/threonine-protein kinase n=1 Tax=Polyangium aurulentum TaxID=2567896 RepID=UPI0010ADBA30|nr:serine/threonine-protein kinase [Polyangium aurulentum]UQA58738.1 serine/threonine-protein kinase [Polyangium aurulentum]
MAASVSPAADRCLEENTLDALTQGQLSPEERARAARHLDACESCRQLLAALGHALPAAGEGEETRPMGARPDPAGAPVVAGGRIGRYTVLHLVGTGGMGAVYAAYDPELDRRVALKLVHHDLLPSDQRRESALRLLREAQALARLSHPHVITVFDAGRFDEQVFLAMEFIDGGTLRQWLRGARRAPDEVLDMFLASGRGLSAAHEAGLVHRDFKPDNVLVGKDGRARVTDFGLARTAIAGEEMPGEEGAPRALPASEGMTTRTGALLGTPRYMAPELLRGAPADSGSDQFAFCVALWEALEGEPPFTAADLNGGPDRAPLREPRGHRIPPPLSRILLRGLSESPGDRFPSMQALLAALEREKVAPGRRRGRILALVGVVALMAVTFGVVRWRGGAEGVCGHAGERLGGAWDEARRSQVRAALLATGVPYANTAWSGTERLLDHYANGWMAMHTEACEATHVRGEQSGELLDLRMACLAQRRAALRALTSLLATADAGVVESAVQAAGQLPPLEECASREALTSTVPPPQNPEAGAKIEATRAKLTDAEALLAAGRYEASRALAQEAVEAASALSYRPLQAEAFLALGRAHMRSEDGAGARQALSRALGAAIASEHVVITARATVSLAFVEGLMLRRHEQGHVWADLAEATLERAGEAPLLTAERLYVLGRLLQDEGRAGEAAPHLEKALALQERVLGPEHPEVVKTLERLAWTLATFERTADAEKIATRALALCDKLLGPDHPQCVRPLHTMGFVLSLSGRNPEAIPYMERALAIEERAFGPSHPAIVKSIINLSNCHNEREAVVLLARALEIQERAGRVEHPDTAFILKNLAISEGLLRRDREQLAHALRALPIEEKLLGQNHPDLAMSLLMIGTAHHRLGHAAEGVPFLERALVIAESRPITDSYATGRDTRIQIRKALADALWELGRDHGRARDLVAGALEVARGGEGAEMVKGATELEAWMTEHPPPR